ncbi:MAG: aspartyl protease family protein [Gammaproteobacteria bacterium]
MSDDAEFVVARFTFRVDPGIAALPIDFAGKRRLLLLDTGATRTALDSSLCGELGRPLRAVRIETLGGRARADVFRAPRMTLGDELLNGVPEVACVNMRPFCMASGAEFGGMLGMDFLGERRVRIDFDRGEVLMLSRIPKGAGVAVPLNISPQRPPAVTVDAHGMGELTFLVDTAYGGGDGIVARGLFNDLVERGLAIQIGKARGTSVAGTRTSRMARIGEIAVGGVRHRGLIMDDGVGEDNLLGLGFLSRYVVTFDFPGKTMYLKPGARFSEPSRYDLSGAHIWRPNDTTVIDSVDRYSSAEEAGLEARDVIVAIDSRAAESLTLFQLRKVLCLPGEHTLHIKRREKTTTVSLHLKEPGEG